MAVSGDSKGQDYQVENKGDLADYVHRYHVVYSVAFDPTLRIGRQYQTTAFPNIVIIGTDGVVHYNRIGRESFADIERVLDSVLSGKSTAARTF